MCELQIIGVYFEILCYVAESRAADGASREVVEENLMAIEQTDREAHTNRGGTVARGATPWLH